MIIARARQLPAQQFSAVVLFSSNHPKPVSAVIEENRISPAQRCKSLYHTALQPLCRAPKTQVLSFQQNPSSFSKTPGVGVAMRVNRLRTLTKLTERRQPSPSSHLRPGIFAPPVFSSTYKSLFQQLPCFHIYTKRRGVGVSALNFSKPRRSIARSRGHSNEEQGREPIGTYGVTSAASWGDSSRRARSL